MNNDAAREALAKADLLADQTAGHGRWLIRFYVIFGAASVLMAMAFGTFHGLVAVVSLTALWLVLVIAISIYANTRQAVVRGMGRLHALVMIGWTLVWVVTIMIGTSKHLGWPWFAAGGVSMLIVCLVGAYAAHRRTSGRSA